MSADIEDLKDAMSVYCDVNAYDCEAWLDDLDAQGGEQWRVHMRELLDETIEKKLLTKEDYERLTNDVFATEAEYEAYLVRLRAYLFADGKHPFYIGEYEPGG